MKTKLLALLLPLVLFACTNKNTNEISITGHIEGIEDGIVISLGENKGNMSVYFLKDTIRNGKFSFSYIDSIPEVKQISLHAHGEGFPPTWLDLWIAPGAKTKIRGSDKLLRTWRVESNIEEQKEYNKYIDINKEYLITNQKNMRDAYIISDSIDSSNDPEVKAGYRQRIDSLYKICDSLDVLILENELNILESSIYNQVYMSKLLSHAQILSYMGDEYRNADRLKKIYNRLSESEKNTTKGQKIADYLFPPHVVKDGDKMVDADLIDLEGNSKKLSDYSGKYLLLDFWSEGCGPCIASIPEMKEIAEKYKDQLVVIGINSDPEDMWKKFSTENDIAGINLNSTQSSINLMLYYGIKGIPHYTLIAPNDTVISSWEGYGKGSLLKKMTELIK